MALIHHGRLNAFCHATEDAGKVKEAIRGLTPFDWEKRKDLAIESERLEGQFGNPIISLTLNLDGKDCAAAFKHIIKGLPEGEAELVARTVGERTDDNCFFYIRLDKQAAFDKSARLGKIDVVQFSAKLAAYPAKKENAILSARKLLGE